MPSWRSPSETMPYIRWSTIAWPGRLNSAARRRSAIAMPTPFAKPWPSGPVVASTPGVRPCSGWPGRARAPLAELLEIVEGEVVPGQVQERVQEHARVAGGEHEPVAIGPVGLAGCVLEEPGPDDVGHRRRAHRGARVAGVGLLDAVDRQGANGVDRQLIESFRCQRHRVLRWHVGRAAGWRVAALRRHLQPAAIVAVGGRAPLPLRVLHVAPAYPSPRCRPCHSVGDHAAHGRRGPFPVRRESPSSATSCSTWCWPPSVRWRPGPTCPGGSACARAARRRRPRSGSRAWGLDRH